MAKINSIPDEQNELDLNEGINQKNNKQNDLYDPIIPLPQNLNKFSNILSVSFWRDLFQNLFQKFFPKQIIPPSITQDSATEQGQEAQIANTLLKSDNKKILVLAIGGAVLVIVIILLIFFITKRDARIRTGQNLQISMDSNKIQKLADEELPEATDDLPVSNIDNLIIKGNLLYKQGHHQEAYDVFKKISSFSQSIATYNLGTIQLAHNSYEDAIASYADSIQTGQNVSISAINAAVSSYKLDRFDLYHYYLKVANDNLLDSVQEPYYSYVNALLKYYKGHYFEALSPLLNPNSKDFEHQNMRLAAHIFTLFGDDEKALESLIQASNEDDYKTIGLLYARIADYTKAKNYLSRYLKNNNRDVESVMAMQIIDLKLRNFSNASTMLENIAKNEKILQEATKTYPIKITLNEELFDVSLAQKIFWEKDFRNNDKIGYKTLFYFAPYRVFDVKMALKEIQRGTSLRQVNIQEGKNVLLRSSTTSKIDRIIIDGLVRLETKDLRYSLENLKAIANTNPNHAILYYNLGLIYAQLGYYDEAYTHFVRAYHLDQSDYLAGALAVISGRFSHKDTNRILFDMMQSYQNDDVALDESQKAFIGNFLNYIGDNHIESDWIKKAKIREPIFYALQFSYALRNKDKKEMLKNIGSLKEIYPKDVVVNILHLLTSKFGENLQENAMDTHSVLKSDALDLRSIYYGGALPRELYVYSGFVSGFLGDQAKIVQDHIISQESNTNGALQTIGLIYIYQKEFQKAYAVYNTLLDNLRENDSQTQFLAAVSAVGAKNYGDAALLLQLAKMETQSIYEALFALGLLYQSAGNFMAAASHYRLILPENFRSEFFDFQIDARANYAYELQEIANE